VRGNAVKHFWLEKRQVSYKELRMFLSRFAFGTLDRRDEFTLKGLKGLKGLHKKAQGGSQLAVARFVYPGLSCLTASPYPRCKNA